MYQQLLFVYILFPAVTLQSHFNPSYLCEQQNGKCETQCSVGKREIGRWPLCFDSDQGCCIEETATAAIEIDTGCSERGGSCRTYCAKGSILQGDLCATGVCCVQLPSNTNKLPCSALGAECHSQCGQNQVEITGNTFCTNGVCCANTVTTQQLTKTSNPTTAITSDATSSGTTQTTQESTTTTITPTTIVNSTPAPTETSTESSSIDSRTSSITITSTGDSPTIVNSTTPAITTTDSSTESSTLISATNTTVSSPATDNSTTPSAAASISTSTTETVTKQAANVLDPDCGADALKVKTRIINGMHPGPCQVPWTVSIRVIPNSVAGYSFHVCSGVLIDPETVLSSADCISALSVAVGGASMFSASVVIGENDPEVPNEANDTEIPIADYITHDLYDSQNRENNIGILKLNESVVYNACALPACTANGAAKFSDVSKCQIVGFGSNINDRNVNTANLTVGQVTVYSPTICQTFFSFLRKTSIPNTVCSVSSSDNNVDACNGDDGGVLMCPDVTGKMMLRGLINDFTCSEGDKPSVYIDITKYESWIRSKMGK